MKVTFIIPPVLDNTSPTERTSGCTYVVYPVPNIYELTVAAVIEKEGHEVAYLDCIEKKLGKPEFEEFLSRDDSEVYSIWTVNLGIENDITAQSIIRERRKDAFIMFMGPAPTYYSDRFLIDDKTFAVRGEPEITIKELLNAVKNNSDFEKVEGISFVKDGERIDTPSRPLIKDLDQLPFPARHLINKDYYHNPKLKLHPYTQVVTSRNCPYKCIYCVPSSLTFARELEHKKSGNRKPPVSMRSVENVLEEVRMLKEQGYKAISFQDDNFIWNEERTESMCKGLREVGMVWGCQARVDAITENTARWLSESGCVYVDLGVESFDQEILDYIKKGITTEQIEKAVGLLKKYNVPVKLNILFGTSPLETKETIDKTYRMIKKLGVNQVMFNIAAPFPGTEFYEMAKSNGWIVGGEYVPTDVQKGAIVSYPNLSKKDLEKAVFWGNVKFFLRPSFLIRHAARIRSPKDFYTSLIGLKRKLFG